eukprot:6586732-Prymnesium_polylepis.1
MCSVVVWCKAKGVCPRCLAINAGSVRTQSATSTRATILPVPQRWRRWVSSRAIKRANQDAAQARIVNQRLDDFSAKRDHVMARIWHASGAPSLLEVEVEPGGHKCAPRVPSK